MIDRRDLVAPRTNNLLLAHGHDPLIVMDARMIAVYKRLKAKYPDVFVNNYPEGPLMQSGFRDDTGIGKTFSQHRYGRALDIHTTKTFLGLIRRDILNHHDRWPEITAMEDPSITPGWLHIDCRWTENPSKILMVGGG